MDLLLWLALLALPTAALFVVVAAPVALARRGRSAALAVASLLLLVAWVVTGYQAGVRADETHTGGNVFDNVGWLVAAVVLTVVALVVGRAPRD